MMDRLISHERRAGERRQRSRSRRRDDRRLLWALISACAFLFVVNVVFGIYVFTTTQRVDSNTKAVSLSFCIQTDAYRSALVREDRLAVTDTSKAKRKTHRESANQLKDYLDKIEPVAHCQRRPKRRAQHHRG